MQYNHTYVNDLILDLSANGAFSSGAVCWNAYIQETIDSYATACDQFEARFKNSSETFKWNTQYALLCTEADETLLTITQDNSGYPTTDPIILDYTGVAQGSFSVSAVGSFISGSIVSGGYISLGDATIVFDEGTSYGELTSFYSDATGTLIYGSGVITLDTLTSGFSAGNIIATYQRPSNTDYISLTAKADETFYIQASDEKSTGENITEAGVLAASTFLYKPLSLTIVVIPGTETSTSTSLSTYWTTTSGDYYPISGDFIRWDISDDTLIAAEIFSDPYTFGDLATLDSTLTAASAFFNSSETSYTTYTITPTISDNADWITYRTPVSYVFAINSYAKYTIMSSTLNAINLSAYYNTTTKEFPADFRIRWGVTNVNSESLLVSSVGDPNQTIEADGFGPSLPYADTKYVHISSRDWSKSYLITISGSDGFTWTNDIYFKPYAYLDSTVTLSATVVQTSQTAPVTYLTLNVYGLSTIEGVYRAFNLYDDQLIVYGNQTVGSDVVAYNRWYTDLYNFVSITELAPFDTNLAYNIDPLNLEVTTPTVSTIPQLSTYQLSVSAFEIDESTLIVDSDIVFYVSEWASDSIFWPAFSINNELSSTHILYRDVNDLTFPWEITIHNRSVVPNDAIGDLKFTFSNGDVSSQSVDFTNFTHEIPTGYSTYTIQICGDGISASVWPLPQTKTGDTKTVNIVADFPTIDFVIYPEYKWDSGTETFVPILCDQSITPGVCAWGTCHTETFTLSAHPETNATYFWYISGIAEPFGSNENLVEVQVISTSATETRGVSCKLVTPDLPASMPNYHYDDMSGLVTAYKNFTTTEYDPTILKQPITMVSFFNYYDDTSVLPTISYNPFGVDAHTLTMDVVPSFSVSVPVEISRSSSSVWNISTYQWEKQYITTVLPKVITLSVSSRGEQIETIGQYLPTIFNIGATVDASLASIGASPPFTDWCTIPIDINVISTTVTAYPLKPVIYTSNKYVVTGTSIAFENLIPAFNLIQQYTWTDRDNEWKTATNSIYVTSYLEDGEYDITLATTYAGYGLTSVESKTFENIVNVVNYFEPYDSDIERIYQVSVLELPLRIDQCQVPPNEWITDWNINKVFDQLEVNVDYLSDKAKLYDVPPTSYYGWLGTLQEGVSSFFHWRVNQEGIDLGYDSSLNAETDYFSNLTDCAVRSVDGVGDNIHFISNKTSVKILSSDMSATEIAERTYKGIGDDFINIKAIDVDANFDVDSRVYILDSGKYRVLVFNYDFSLQQWKLLYSWGGLGGVNSKNKFYDPTDILVSEDNELWVTDYNNRCIKKFARTGTWLATYTNDVLTTNNKPISMVLDSDDNIYVLTQNGIYKFDSNFTLIKTFTIPQLETETAKRLTTCQDGGFFYICTDQSIIKVGIDGVIAGQFATEYGSILTSCYHDANRNLYITTNNTILKYIDKLDIVNLRTDVSSLWPMSAIYIEPDEYNQDWVLNRSFARYWDNLEVFRRSIIGKFTYETVNGIQVPTVRTFTPEEYQILPYSKNEIYVGINENVTADAINRCINKLYACQETLLEMIQD